jgi:hypothetical protein
MRTIMETRMSSEKVVAGGRSIHFAAAVLAVCLLTIGATARPASAFIDIPDYGSTGWNGFSVGFDPSNPFTGQIGFLVSDHGDDIVTSWLLIDNIVASFAGGSTTYGFESGDLAGFSLVGTGGAVNASTYSTPTYSPTEGFWMAEINTDSGVHVDDYGYGGTDGSVLLLPVQGLQYLSFDWNFNTSDHYPFLDFSLVVFQWEAGAPFVYELGRICCGQQQPPTIPEPSTVLLLGAGLVGLGLWGRKRMKKA